MVLYDITYILLVISTLIVLFFLLFLIRIQRKEQIHYAFTSLLSGVFIWNLSLLFYITFQNTNMQSYLYGQFFFLGIIIVEFSTYYVGLIFAKNTIRFSKRDILLIVFYLIDIIILFTNQFHNIFYSQFGSRPSTFKGEIFFLVNAGFSYVVIGIGLAYLGIFTIKNSGFFSKQSILIFLGIIVGLGFDAISTFKIFDWPLAYENIVFVFSFSCFILAIVKFDFLNIVPIAIQTVVDLISDSYVVVNKYFEIIDFNKTFVNIFEGVVTFKRKDNFVELIKKNNLGLDRDKFIELANEAITSQKSVNFEIKISTKEMDKYFLVEIIPIFSKTSHLGTIILLKDITEHKQNLIQVTLLNEKLKELVNRDGLTRAYNRYFFDERLQQEIDRVTKQQTYGQDIYKSVDDFGLIIFDIDFFKHYNDNNGHLAGDELLQELVIVVKSALFPTDILCRYGGEEFAVICCKTSAEGVVLVAEKIRAAVEEYNFKFQEKQPNDNLTVSVGVSYCDSPDMTREDLIRFADRRLYKAKELGRNKVVFND